MKRILLLLLAALAVGTPVSPAPAAAQARTAPELLLDDIGMNHSVNMAVEEFARRGIPFSTSVLVVAPWYQEVVAILKQHPHVSVGVHLALNSEWKGYRWGPVLGREAVPSLVDSVGCFTPSTATFLKTRYDLGEVERELSAQVERALRSGLKIAYVDYHTGTAVATPELRAVVERVAKKYGLGVSRYFGEGYHTMFDTPIDQKKPQFLAHLRALKPGAPNLVWFTSPARPRRWTCSATRTTPRRTRRQAFR